MYLLSDIIKQGAKFEKYTYAIKIAQIKQIFNKMHLYYIVSKNTKSNIFLYINKAQVKPVLYSIQL